MKERVELKHFQGTGNKENQNLMNKSISGEQGNKVSSGMLSLKVRKHHNGVQ